MMNPVPLPGSGAGGPAYDDTALKARLDQLEAERLVLLSVIPITTTQTIASIAELAPAGATHVEFETIGGGCSGMRITGFTGAEGGTPGSIHRSERFKLSAFAEQSLDLQVGAGGLGPASAVAAGATAPMNPGSPSFVAFGSQSYGTGQNPMRRYLSFGAGGLPYRPATSTTTPGLTYVYRLLGQMTESDYVPCSPRRQYSGENVFAPAFAVRGPGAGGCSASPGASALINRDDPTALPFTPGGRVFSPAVLSGADAPLPVPGACGGGGAGSDGNVAGGHGGLGGGGGGCGMNGLAAGNGGNGLIRVLFYGAAA